MTRSDALAQLHTLVANLPPGTVEEKASRAAERLAAREDADVLRSVLVELALERLVVAEGEGRC